MDVNGVSLLTIQAPQKEKQKLKDRIKRFGIKDRLVYAMHQYKSHPSID